MNETLCSFFFFLFFCLNAGAGHKVTLDSFQLRFNQDEMTSLSCRLKLYHVDIGNFILAAVWRNTYKLVLVFPIQMPSTKLFSAHFFNLPNVNLHLKNAFIAYWEMSGRGTYRQNILFPQTHSSVPSHQLMLRLWHSSLLCSCALLIFLLLLSFITHHVPISNCLHTLLLTFSTLFYSIDIK